MATLMQHPGEVEWFCERIRGAGSLLEVGAYDGGSLLEWARVLARGARIRVIDNGMHGDAVKRELLVTVRRLLVDGFDVEVFCGDSHGNDARIWALGFAPYDVVFIDGDHSYVGVRTDWDAYGRMGRLVAFHDICSPVCEVAPLWRELRGRGLRTEECFLGAIPIYGEMGIGVVHRGNGGGE